nr:hypothetical protein [Tanacetum cinerariifolium]
RSSQQWHLFSLAGGTFLTSSGNFFWQWELFTDSGNALCILFPTLYQAYALGWILEEIHVTWAHLEKKQTRLRTYTKSLEDLCKQWLETAPQA